MFAWVMGFQNEDLWRHALAAWPVLARLGSAERERLLHNVRHVALGADICVLSALTGVDVGFVANTFSNQGLATALVTRVVPSARKR